MQTSFKKYIVVRMEASLHQQGQVPSCAEITSFSTMLSQCSPSISIFSGLGNLKHDAVITLADPEMSVRGHYNIPFVFVGIDSYGYMMYLI